MYKRYIEALQLSLQEHADPNVKDWWQNYVKQSAPFMGVKMPLIRAMLQAWHGQTIAEQLDLDQQKDLALALLQEEHSEEKLAGILFLQEILMPAGVVRCDQDLDRFAQLFAEGSIYDWNICDWFCVKVLGPLVQQEGEDCAEAISQWRRASNLWQARASVVAFVKVAENSSYYPLIKESCQELIRREERFAKTSVGWILRDVSKYDQGFVRDFVADNLVHFSLESLRNALKYFPKEERNSYIRLFKDSKSQVKNE